MTIKQLKQTSLSVDQLKDLPLPDLYEYWKVRYDISKGEPWESNKKEIAYNQFREGYTLTRFIEDKFTVHQEAQANTQLGYKGFKASYNELISTL